MAAGSAAPPPSPSRVTTATASLSWRSGRVTVAMIHAASKVPMATMATIAVSAGLAKVLLATCRLPSDRRRWWATRYR